MISFPRVVFAAFNLMPRNQAGHLFGALTISFKSDRVKLPFEIFYFYSKRKHDGSSMIKEREPNRSILLMPPESYEGKLGVSGISH